MYMILVCSNFYKIYFVTFLYPFAGSSQCFLNCFGKYFSPVFCRTYYMIQQETLIVFFKDVVAHPANITPDLSPRNSFD